MGRATSRGRHRRSPWRRNAVSAARQQPATTKRTELPNGTRVPAGGTCLTTTAAATDVRFDAARMPDVHIPMSPNRMAASPQSIPTSEGNFTTGRSRCATPCASVGVSMGAAFAAGVTTAAASPDPTTTRAQMTTSRLALRMSYRKDSRNTSAVPGGRLSQNRVEVIGFEPTTPAVRRQCSTGLSYTPGSRPSVAADIRTAAPAAARTEAVEPRGVVVAPTRLPAVVAPMRPLRTALRRAPRSSG